MHIYPGAYTHVCLYVDTHVCVYIHIYLYIIFHSGQRSPFCNRMILFDTKNCQDDNQSWDLFSYTSTFKWKESHLLLLRKWFCLKNSLLFLMYCWILFTGTFHFIMDPVLLSSLKAVVLTWGSFCPLGWKTLFTPKAPILTLPLPFRLSKLSQLWLPGRFLPIFNQKYIGMLMSFNARIIYSLIPEIFPSSVKYKII